MTDLPGKRVFFSAQVYLEASRALVVTESEEEAAYQRCNTSFALTMAGPYRVFVFA
jgi:hypothetical protein